MTKEKKKIVHGLDGHPEIVSRPPAIENSRQVMLVSIDMSQKILKQSVSAPSFLLDCDTRVHSFSCIMANQVQILGLQRFVLELKASLFLRINVYLTAFFLERANY